MHLYQYWWNAKPGLLGSLPISALSQLSTCKLLLVEVQCEVIEGSKQILSYEWVFVFCFAKGGSMSE